MKISEELIVEQNKIIESDDSRIVISAVPGSGKTYTLTKKAAKELKVFEDNNINKGVILCSFTRESALDLDKKINNLIENDFSFIGTIDSFILTRIINPFKNRILKVLKPNSKIICDKLKVSIPTLNRNEQVNIITREGLTNFNQQKVVTYYNNWIDNLIDSKYEVSFAAYLFAGKAVEVVPELKAYIINRFHSIYIDEAQDLNFFQIRFIKKLIESTSINCYLIGDKRQSIYGFRGAKPDLFYSMVDDEGFVEHKITHSARCHYHILEFSRRIVGESIKNTKLLDDKRVINNYSIINHLDILKDLNDYFILVESNEEAEQIYLNCLDKGLTNIIYSRKIYIESDKIFSDNYYDLVEEVLKFYYNHTNIIPEYTYSLEKLFIFLEPHITNAKLKESNLAIKNGETVVNYLKRIFLLGDIMIPQSVLTELNDQLNQDVYRSQYILYQNVNRIMTIHSSKGLEAKYVFMQFKRKTFSINDETKRKLFVGFTRAKERLLIGFDGDLSSPVENHINNIFSETFEKVEEKNDLKKN